MGGRGSGGHNRKSKRERKVKGNAGKRKTKQRRRRSPEFSGPLGPAPKHFHKAEIEIWNELSAIVPVGIVEASDRWSFELLVCQMLKFRRGNAKAGEVAQIASLLARLGMTPADRGRVEPRDPTDQAKPVDKYAKFLPPNR